MWVADLVSLWYKIVYYVSYFHWVHQAPHDQSTCYFGMEAEWDSQLQLTVYYKADEKYIYFVLKNLEQ